MPDVAREKEDKKLVLIPSSTVKRLYSLAAKSSESPSIYIAKILDEALKVLESGGSMKDLVDFYFLANTLRKSGAVILPGDLFQFMVDKVYRGSREDLNKVAFEAGQWVGKYLAAKSLNCSPEDTLKAVLPMYMWDASEIYVDCSSKSMKIRYISSSRSHERSELLSSFLEGVASALGYALNGKEVYRGVVSLDFAKEQQPVQS